MATWNMHSNEVRIKKANILMFHKANKKWQENPSNYKQQALVELAHRLALEEQIMEMISNHNKLLDKYEQLKDAAKPSA